MTTDMTEFARGIFQSQPFSQFLGAELTAVSEDSAEIRVQNRKELQQQHGFIHGGVISYLADNSSPSQVDWRSRATRSRPNTRSTTRSPRSARRSSRGPRPS